MGPPGQTALVAPAVLVSPTRERPTGGDVAQPGPMDHSLPLPPLRPMDRAWLERWAVKLDARFHPSTSGASEVSWLLRRAVEAGVVRGQAEATTRVTGIRASASA